MIKFAHVAIACSAVLACATAHAVHVTALPGSTTYPIPVEEYFGTGPRDVAPGITWTAEDANSVFGWTGGYFYQTNGTWDGLSMIGTNTGTSAMSVTFDTAVQGVGAFLNWSRFEDGTPDGDLPVISVYDSSSALLESYTLTFVTDGSLNSGEFHGFLRDGADIKSIVFSGGFIGAANLEVVAIPEPQTVALMLGGLLAVGASVRRRRQG